MKILLSLLYLFIFIIISCNNKQSKKIFNNNSNKTELIILNKSISVNDSLQIEFRSNQPYHFVITENKLVDFVQNDKEYFHNNLTLLYTNKQGEILNNLVIREKDFDKKNKSFFEYDCYSKNINLDTIIWFTLNNSEKQFKFKMESELIEQINIKNSEGVYLQIQYVSNINDLRYCYNNSRNNLFKNNKIAFFNGELLSNKVLINR